MLIRSISQKKKKARHSAESDPTPLLDDLSRMENCSPNKAEAIVGVIRAILNEEMNRQSSYVGLNIYQDEHFPSRLNYGRSYGELYDEFGHIATAHFLEFETAAEAARFLPVLQGILMLGLSRFKINRADFTYHGGYTPWHPSDVHNDKDATEETVHEQSLRILNYFKNN